MLYVIGFSAALTAALLVVFIGSVAPARSRAVRNRMVALGLHGSEAVTDLARDARARTRRFDSLLEVLGARWTGNPDEFTGLRARMVHAGYRERGAPALFMGGRIVAAFAGFALGTLMGTFLDLSGGLATFAGGWGAVFGWAIPGFALSRKVAKRQHEVRKALPDALDLLVICVEAGLGINQALVRVASEMAYINFTLTEEIAQANLEIRAGTPREQALRRMAERTGVAEVKSLVTMLIQTERFGTSIARSLRVHSETLRERRRQRAEEAAAKTAIKMVFPLAICILPSLFVVVLAPALITIFQTLGGL